jgi:thymidylate synthase
MGSYTHISHSMHLYDNNYETVKEMLYSMLLDNKTIKEIAEALTEYVSNELI